MTNRTKHVGLSLVSLTVLIGCSVTGCVDYNNRPPASAEEVKKADQNRQAYVDTIPNLTPEQRAQMKSHMGGPSAPPMGGPPAAGAADPKGRQ